MQTDALDRAGVVRLFIDTATGASKDRTGRKEPLYHARENDVVTVWRLDRLARSLKDLIEIVGQLHSGNIGLISLTENLNTTTPPENSSFTSLELSPNLNVT